MALRHTLGPLQKCVKVALLRKHGVLCGRAPRTHCQCASSSQHLGGLAGANRCKAIERDWCRVGEVGCRLGPALGHISTAACVALILRLAEVNDYALDWLVSTHRQALRGVDRCALGLLEREHAPAACLAAVAGTRDPRDRD